MVGVRQYHIDLGQKDVRTGMYDRFVYDEAGIPQYPYDGELHYNPTFVAHHGLYHLSLYQRAGEPAELSTFLASADWFLGTGRRSRLGLTFEYTMPVPGLPDPWISALGQGRAISVLTRAYEAAGNQAYLDAASLAVIPFTLPVSEGGVATSFPDGGVAFEEYPRTRPDLVLNGLITALFGLYDLAATEGSHDRDSVARLFRTAVDALASNLHRYDLAYWSAYDLTGRISSNEYHRCHVSLLWALYEITGVDSFAACSRRWADCQPGARLFVRRNVSRVASRLRDRRLS